MINQLNTQLGKKLQAFRERRFPNESLRRVALSLEFDYSYLYRLEEGFYKPTDEKLASIAKVYELSQEEVAELLALAQSYSSTIDIMRKKSPEDFEKVLSQAFFRTQKTKKRK